MSSPSSSSKAPGRNWNARTAACEILRKIEQYDVFADEAFDRFTRRIHLHKQDLSLAFDLVYGVLRHRGTLDWHINLVADRPIHRLPASVAQALRLGAYQIRYLDKIPHSAAVNESVKLVKTTPGRNWAGFVNGVLRSLCRLPIPPWPEVSEDPVTALSIRYSCPPWLTERWISRFGLEGAQRACRHAATIPPLTLRTNTLRCSPNALEARLIQEGHHVRRTTVSPVGMVLEKCGSLSNLQPLQEGWCYVEDEAAQLVPLLLDVKPGHRVLDACAAPGGKATHIAALMKNQGEIIAIDKNPKRLKVLEENCRRLGVCILTPILASVGENWSNTKEHGSLTEESFDRILVDAPCSGMGVLNRHPEAKWHKGPDRLEGHSMVQNQILEHVWRLLRPGGVLVYSACSTEPEETIQVISRFCRAHPEFYHEASTPWLPPLGRFLVNQDGDLLTMATPYPMDGFFAARLRKEETL